MERDEVLEDEQLVSMKQAFMLFDTDGDGQISPSDLGTIMRSLGSNPTMAEIQEIIDREKLSESIGFDRFMDLMARYLKPENYEWELREAFRVLDKDCTGFVDVSDLRHILTSIGERLDPHEFDEWIRELDVGSDGRFRYDEFIAQLGDK